MDVKRFKAFYFEIAPFLSVPVIFFFGISLLASSVSSSFYSLLTPVVIFLLPYFILKLKEGFFFARREFYKNNKYKVK